MVQYPNLVVWSLSETFKMKFTLIAFAILCVRTTVAGNHRPKYACRKQYHPCVYDYCCCSSVKAVCDGHRHKLSYIPELPQRIKSLKFSSNVLPKITKSVFKNVTDLTLEELIIEEDEVVNISEDAFSVLESLKVLRFKGNRQINRTQLFEAIGWIINKRNLKTLDLTNIGISGRIPVDLINVINGSFLQTVIMDDNNITSVSIKDFENVSSLRFLRFSPGAISQFDTGYGHPALKSLVLTHNKITIYPPDFCASDNTRFPQLQYLYLDYNFISVITPEHFSCLTNLRRLVMSANVLRNIPNNVISNLQHLIDFRVGHMFGLQGREVTIDKFAFNSSSLRRLEMDSNNIIFNRQHVTNNVFESCKHLTYLNIRKNNMIKISDAEITQLFSPLVKLEKFYLDANHLRTIPEYMLRNFTKLIFLNVDGNSIQAFGNSLIGPKSLRHLSANGNSIRFIRPESFPESVRKTLRRLNLSQNPFACTCENLWFRNWIGEEGNPRGTHITLESWPYRYQCSTPTEWNHKDLKTYRPTEESCNRTRNIIIISSSFGSLSLIALVCFLIGLRYRWYVMYLCYRLKQTTKNRDPERRRLMSGAPVQPYTYVIYHDDDSDFVHHTLRTTLEENLGFNLYIWHRDSINGSKAHVMFDAIESSENVLAVISNNFVKDGWCEFQLEIGLSKKNTDRNDCLTLLLLEDLDCGLLRRSWCVTLVKNASINWNSDTQTVQGRLCFDRLSARLSPTQIE